MAPISRNAEVIWCSFQSCSSTAGIFCPCVNSLTILSLCPCGLRNDCCVYSLGDQHVSLWPWPSHSCCASCRSRRSSWPLFFKAFCWGTTRGNILFAAGRARGTSFLWLMSPLPNSFIVLSFKEPVIKFTTLSFQSNQTLLLDLIVFQLFIGVPVGRLKCWYKRHQSFSLHMYSEWVFPNESLHH